MTKEITPVSKGQLPKPKKTFVPPMIVKNEHPKLTIDPSLINPPETLQNNLPNWGDPLAKLGIASNGTGFGGGMGDGKVAELAPVTDRATARVMAADSAAARSGWAAA